MLGPFEASTSSKCGARGCITDSIEAFAALQHTWEFPTAIKRVAFSEDETRIVLVTERRMGFPGSIEIFNIDPSPDAKQQREPAVKWSPEGSKSVAVAWSYLDKHIVSGHEDGAVALFDAKSGEQLNKVPAHDGLITDLQMSPDRTWFLTSSKDKTAKVCHGSETLRSENPAYIRFLRMQLHDADTLALIKTYQNEAPVNSAAAIPGKPYVLIGGGQEAMSVTTTSARQGHFEVRMLHQIFEEEVAKLKGGFGPCNTIAVHPKGTGYAIGGEDGYVRVHQCVILSKSYLFRQLRLGADLGALLATTDSTQTSTQQNPTERWISKSKLEKGV